MKSLEKLNDCVIIILFEQGKNYGILSRIIKIRI